MPSDVEAVAREMRLCVMEGQRGAFNVREAVTILRRFEREVIAKRDALWKRRVAEELNQQMIDVLKGGPDDWPHPDNGGDDD